MDEEYVSMLVLHCPAYQCESTPFLLVCFLLRYDYVVLGTGLTECILSGLLSVDGKKVLHMDRNDYYGAESASLNLTQLYRKFRPGQEPPTELGRDRDWAIDLIPKIAGSYVLAAGKVAKVPSSEVEAVTSPLMGIFEKRRAKKFLEWVANYRLDDPSTHQGISLESTTMEDVYTKFSLEAATQDFIGHALALHSDESYKTKPVKETYERIMLYTKSVARYGKSPYIYPLYGLGELPQGFARLSAIYGGTYMLDKPIDEIVYDDQGKVSGVRSGTETVKAKKVIGDPSYFLGGNGEKVVEQGKVVRSICLLKHPVPNTDDSDSFQLVIPQAQVNRKHDIYIAAISSTHNVCAKDYYVAIVSTIVETSTPELELDAAYKLIGPIHDKSVLTVSPIYAPSASGQQDNVFITRSYDATSHFETVTDDVKDVWRRAVGGEIVLKKREAGDGGLEAQA
ncbi:hypothetical protein PSHT_11341 [Puccinia striiformis]|uniref:Rab GDP dissociation inhibitor n=1 Tax=Puccinia striiformis TaxID=27350 RepID=A0A2S4V3N9_9BASI|nr:hypothetical protein PSHT_11341 [Puccinia striiformis]